MEFAIRYQTFEQMGEYDKDIDILKENIVRSTSMTKYQSKVLDETISILERYFDNISIDTVYFGSEFCEKHIPDIQTIKQVCNFVERNNLKLVLVTPLVTDKGILSLTKIFDYLSETNKDIEVVVNDYGVMNLINKKYINFPIILGRTMHKMTSDPRIKSFINGLKKHYSKSEKLEYFMGSSYSLSDFTDFMNENGVYHGELDIVYQGVSLDNINDNMSFSLNLPYTYISSGRYCYSAALNNKRDLKFSIDAPCKKECLEYIFKISNNKIQEDMFRRGQSIVHRMYNDVNLKDYLENPKITRIILAPHIPF